MREGAEANGAKAIGKVNLTRFGSLRELLWEGKIEKAIEGQFDGII